MYEVTTAATPQVEGLQFVDMHGHAIAGGEYGADGWLSDKVIGNIRARLRERELVSYAGVAPDLSMMNGLHSILASVASNSLAALPGWYPGTAQIKKFGPPGDSPHRAAGTGTFENAFRSLAGMSLGMALCAAHAIPGAPARANLVAAVDRYAGSMLKAHRANNSNPIPASQAEYDAAVFPSWGGSQTDPLEATGSSWQAALWVALAARAVWVLRSDLPVETMAAAEAALRWEADRFITVQPPFWADPEGWIITPGDTKAEENSWNGLSLAVAYAWTGEMKYRRPALLWSLSAQSTKQAVQLQDAVSGINMAELGGWNLHDDYFSENHGEIIPNYLVAPVLTWGMAAACFAEREGRIPHATIMSTRRVYSALQNRVIPQGYGGYTRNTTVYLPGSPQCAYAASDTAGGSGDKFAMDVINHVLGDSLASGWAELHKTPSLSQTSAGTLAKAGEAHWAAMNAACAFELSIRIGTAVIEEA